MKFININFSNSEGFEGPILPVTGSTLGTILRPIPGFNKVTIKIARYQQEPVLP
jgi:hypothetical protein